MQITLKKPVKSGQSCLVHINTANGVGRQPNGALLTSEVLDGDSSAPTADPTSTDKKLVVRVYGDGSLGEKKVRVHLDTQVGKAVEGKPVHRVAQDVDINYTVVCPDCDEVKVSEVEGGEDLPATHERSYMRH